MADPELPLPLNGRLDGGIVPRRIQRRVSGEDACRSRATDQISRSIAARGDSGSALSTR